MPARILSKLALQFQMAVNVPVQSSALSGRYAIYGEIASGGMASVLYGRLLGPVGFARPVAIKRLHPHIAREPALVSMFIDEARICARVSHANVVPTLDVIEAPGELSLVMEYVHGCTLETLLELAQTRGERLPLHIVGALMLGVLHGLEAAHEARSESGEPLHIVHRDVSPQNVMVGADGIPRLFDFGIAKARGRLRSTPSGQIKGKLSYMAPEQLGAGVMDARVDVYGAGVVLWELLTGRTLFDGEHESSVVHSVLYAQIEGPRALRSEVSEVLDALVLRALSRAPEQRFQSAREMARALERALPCASQSELSEWLDAFAGERLRARAEWLRELQRASETGRGRSASELPAAVADESAPRPASDAREVTSGGHASFVRSGGTRVRLAVAAFALLVLGTALAYWAKGDGRAPATSEAAGKAQPAAKPKPSALPAGAETLREQPHDPPPQAPAPVIAAPEPGPGPAARQAPARESREPSKREAGGAAHKAQTPDCHEPYSIDARGVKHWKRECL